LAAVLNENQSKFLDVEFRGFYHIAEVSNEQPLPSAAMIHPHATRATRSAELVRNNLVDYFNS
jgi:hypothetical protein